MATARPGFTQAGWTWPLRSTDYGELVHSPLYGYRFLKMSRKTQDATRGAVRPRTSDSLHSGKFFDMYTKRFSTWSLKVGLIGLYFKAELKKLNGASGFCEKCSKPISKYLSSSSLIINRPTDFRRSSELFEATWISWYNFWYCS